MYGDGTTTSEGLPIERALYRIKVSAYSRLCVSRVDGTQVLPLVPVPDVMMDFFNLFVVSLL